jgi:hypothetical protein
MLAESLANLVISFPTNRQVYLVVESKLLFEAARSGLHGEQYESVNLQRSNRERLDQIPVYFFSGDEVELLNWRA